MRSLRGYSNDATSSHIPVASVMDLIVNMVCAVVGIIGTYVVMKAQERGQMKMNMQFELVNDVRSIWERMASDFSRGEVSDSLKTAVRMAGHKIDIYCNSRWFRRGANRKLRNAWHVFQETLAVSVPQRPKRGYGYEKVSKPSDFGLDVKIEAVLSALH